MTTEIILSTKGLVKRFGGVAAVNGVDLEIHKGEIRCLIGPNGAGKSTLFNLLCGVYRPDQGTIFLRGQDITHLPAFRRIQLGLGLKFQTNRAYQYLTVGENLKIATRNGHDGIKTEARERFWLALKASNLEQKQTMLARELPHNELQWLEICMALAAGPDVLLLDEPTTGMTPEETHQTAELTKQLCKGGLTVVVVEHDMAFVRDIAQTITVLHQGRVFTEGDLEQITHNEDVRRIYLGNS